jgi:hypothetical protein
MPVSRSPSGLQREPNSAVKTPPLIAESHSLPGRTQTMTSSLSCKRPQRRLEMALLPFRMGTLTGASTASPCFAGAGQYRRYRDC